MKLKCIILLLAFQLPLLPLGAQTASDRIFTFRPTFNHVSLELGNKFYKLNSGDSIRFDVFIFYISGIEFLLNNKPVWKEENSFHLIDASDEKSLNLILQIPVEIIYDKVKFNLGIDSLTNVSGAMGGDLDPTKGMYWTWQNGYINLKLEGTSNLCTTRNNEFQFHLGGYQFPFSAIQTIALNLKNEKVTEINIELDKFIESCDMVNNNQIMSPSNDAIELSKMFARTFIVSGK